MLRLISRRSCAVGLSLSLSLLSSFARNLQMCRGHLLCGVGVSGGAITACSYHHSLRSLGKPCTFSAQHSTAGRKCSHAMLSTDNLRMS